jgi:ATP-dependent protease ClpP protease subunit
MAAEISLYGNIGAGFFEEGNDAKSVIDQIKAAGMQPIDLHIHSSGGSVFDGYTIYNALQAHAPGVNVHIDGIAASIAAYVAMAGKTVNMAQNGMMMIHNPTIDPGRADRNKMARQMQLLDKVTQSYKEAFVNRGLLTDEQVTAMMDAETWMTAPEAMLAGLIDDVTPELALAASFDLADFKHAPPELIAQAGTRPSKKQGAPQSPPKGYPQSKDQYADPENYKYPIDTKDRTNAAWKYINKNENRSGYSASELTYIENRIKSAAKKFGIKIAEEGGKETEGRFDISASTMSEPKAETSANISTDAAAAPDPQPKPQPAPQPAPAPEPEPKPAATDASVVEKLKALLRPKADLQVEINTLKSQVEVRDTSIAQLNGAIAALNSEVASLKQQAAEVPAILALVSELEKSKTTVEAAAADKIAALGFPAKELPAAKEDKETKENDKVYTEAELLEKINAITDPMEQTKAFIELKPKLMAAWNASRAAQRQRA